MIWLRGKDLNLRPPGYEPDELPTALPRDVRFWQCDVRFGAGDRGRTGTIGEDRGILSPVRLPIPPHRRQKLAPRVGLEPTAYRLTAGCSTIELSRNTYAVALATVDIIQDGIAFVNDGFGVIDSCRYLCELWLSGECCVKSDITKPTRNGLAAKSFKHTAPPRQTVKKPVMLCGGSEPRISCIAPDAELS